MILLDKVEIADTFLARLKGLLGRKKIQGGYGLLLKPCGSIHMFFMKFPIDAFFLAGDEKGFRVLEIKRNLKPWRLALAPAGTKAVLETKPGTVPVFNPGEILTLQ